MNDTHPLDPDVSDKLARLKEIKDQISDLETEQTYLNELFVVPLEGPELIVGRDGVKYRVSKIVNNTAVYDMAVYESLDDETKAAITNTKISATKLQDAARLNKIPMETVVDLVTYVPKKPYAKFDPIA